MKKYLKLLRVKHYMKNALVLAPLVFNQSLLNLPKLIPALLGFLAFCFLSSAVYIFNDICDLEKDRNHPTKRNRPIANGDISVRSATGTAVICLVLAILFQLLTKAPAGFIWLALYLVLNIAYSKGLKDQPVIDIAILSSGFVLRVIYGAAITGIEISGWLYLTIIAGSFYLGLGKRRNEISKSGETGAETRAVLKHYTYQFLDKNMYVFLALTEAFYALWAIGMENKYMLWTVPVVMLIFLKYSLDIEGDSDGDPVEVITHDLPLIFLILVYAAMTLGILYFAK